ncbi:hypothetical protein COT96_00240, partial [Candidatus Falkowbacteria bacterium CG10_big_fil_rev_8_21_14_0_10_38_22]
MIKFPLESRFIIGRPRKTLSPIPSVGTILIVQKPITTIIVSRINNVIIFLSSFLFYLLFKFLRSNNQTFIPLILLPILLVLEAKAGE